MFHVKQKEKRKKKEKVSRETKEVFNLKINIKFILLAVLLSFSLFSCENVEYIERSEQPEESKNIYEKLEEDLPDLNDGTNGEVVEQDFVIATNDSKVFYNEESVSTSLSKAVENRNMFLNDKYGAQVVVKQVKSTALTNALKESLESGIPYCDMICVSAKDSVKLYSAGLLGDMNKLPDFNVESPYFDSENAKSLATNSSLYLLPDETAQVYEKANILFFNRKLVNEIAGKDPESLVMQGKWTWDAFNEAARASASAVYNKSAADVNSDIFAFSSVISKSSFGTIMFASTGNKLIDNTYKNPVGITMTEDNITSVAQTLRKYFNTRGRYPLDGGDAINAFKEGRLAFLSNTLDYYYSLRTGNGEGSDYGVLPMPKLNEEQKDYYCLVSTDARVFSIPKTVESASDEKKHFVSAVISATVASGRTTVKKAFMNDHIVLYMNNNTETVVFETILNSITFDFANVYGSAISQIRKPTNDAINDYIEFGSSIPKTINMFLSAFNQYCGENFK